MPTNRTRAPGADSQQRVRLTDGSPLAVPDVGFAPSARGLAAGIALLLLAVGRLAAQRVDTATALAGLRDASTACHTDAGRLWGRSLCGPIALVEPQTRMILADDTVPGRPYIPLGDGAVVSVLPNGLGLANTSFTWVGRRWAMVLLPLPADRFDRATLVLHENFHRVQDSLGLTARDALNPQLDEAEGRRWFRLELRALAAALDALDDPGTAARRHAQDALLFRAERHALYPHADSLEASLEMAEGLAEYTGERMALDLVGERPARIARGVRAFDARPSYVRSFAYATGPALGFLLDRFRPGWHDEIRRVRNPGALLASALDFHAPESLARAAAARAAEYGDSEIVREEAHRTAARRQILADYRAHLIDGPVLVLRQSSLGRGFNPNELVPMGEDGTVYPTGTFSAEWGKLEVTAGGALVAPDFSWVRVPAPAVPPAPSPQAGTIGGPGWTLTLAPGWMVRPSTGRAGDFEVAKTSSR